MTNLERASEILSRFWSMGMREIVVCAGARNAPFVTLLARETPFQIHSFFDERSAAFFALGKIQGSGHPVAVITTSGTAAAELLPATIEADYQGLPLILVTADRPRRFRGTGAPQAIVQTGLYSHYVEATYDLESERFPENFEWSGKRPVHFNVCFDEPLLVGHAEINFTSPAIPPRMVLSEARAIDFLGKAPLVLLGGLTRAERPLVLEKLRTWGCPVYAEAPSGLRGELQTLEIRGGEKSLRALAYDSVIRIGRVPTLRLWRDLETSEIPVLHFSDLPYSGLPRVRTVHSLAELAKFEPDFAVRSSFTDSREKLEILLAKYPRSEVAWIRALSGIIPKSAQVFLGNSLPIREWDLAASFNSPREIFANRGVNGIDGLISTFIGLAANDKPNWAVIGDLSALYDLNAGWAARHTQASLNLVVINNGGGEIFKRMFHNELFENRHGLDLSAFAKLWSWEYEAHRDPAARFGEGRAPRLIEIFPDLEMSDAFWSEWEKA